MFRLVLDCYFRYFLRDAGIVSHGKKWRDCALFEQVVFTKIGDSQEIRQQAVHIAEYAKKNGLLGLQNKEKEVDRTIAL